jgi:hypothetical protein
MGMSTHVVAFKPPGERWQQMKAVWDACEAAGIEPPDEVSEYFEHEEPDPAGVRIERAELVTSGAVRVWTDADAQGYEVDVTKLPRDVTVIRFYNGW